MKLVWSNIRGIFDWVHAEARHSADNFMRDMRSMRALWNYIYLSLYAFLCVWAALYFAKESLNTAIITTGGIVGTIFTAYVFSTTTEKIYAVKNGHSSKPAGNATVSENENDASD